MIHRRYIGHLLRDIFVVIASILVAFVLVELGIIESFLRSTQSSLVISSFIAGAFFTSVFTIVPAGVALVAIAQSFPILWVAIFGALGSVCVDIVIASFIRKDVTQDIDGVVRTTFFKKHLLKAFHFGFLKWIAFVFGMLLIASPLPDELGLFFVGVSKINPKALPLLLFLANLIGIWAVISIANAI